MSYFSVDAVNRAMDHAAAGYADEEDKRALAYMANPNGSYKERECDRLLKKANRQG